MTSTKNPTNFSSGSVNLVENNKEKEIILVLKKHKGISISKLSEKINYNIGNTSKIINRLEEESIITKEDYAGKDMRAKKIFLKEEMVVIHNPFKNFIINIAIIAGTLFWAVVMSLLTNEIKILIGIGFMAVIMIIKESFDIWSKRNLVFVTKKTKTKKKS